MRHPSFPGPARSPRGGAALLVTLAVLVLVTILVVGLASVAMNEGGAARGHRNRQAALAAANQGFDIALDALRTAVDPVDSLTNTASPTFWSSQPGVVVVFNADGGTNRVSYLYSGAGAAGAVTNAPSDQVDLNPVSYDGNHLFGGSAMAQPMKVGWTNGLRDASSPASSNNPVVTRYAWWIDDESSRVNVNTADGSAKGTAASYGDGFPTEVSLGALGGTFSGRASAIASNAWTRGFSSEGEILGAGVSAADYQTNKPNLTAFGRSAEMNAFGEPKFYLLGVVQTNTANACTNAMIGPPVFVSNQIPGGPLSQIYPTSLQLPDLVMAPASVLQGVAAGYVPPPWGVAGGNVAGYGSLPQFFTWMPPWTGWLRIPYANYPAMIRVAQYLAGYNSRGQAVSWPSYAGYPGTGFAKKYTPRQLDSIALQILDQAADNSFTDSDASGVSSGIASPTYTVGPLSGQLVTGLTRGPHITQVLLGVSAVANNKLTNPFQGGTYSVLELSFQLYLEMYYPPSPGAPVLSGVNQWCIGCLPPWGPRSQWVGNAASQSFNSYDLPAISTNVAMTVVGPSPLSDLPPGTSMAGFPATFRTNDYWMGNMLRVVDHATQTDAGVDLYGNDPSTYDPDQARAALYHPWRVDLDALQHTGQTNYFGVGPSHPALWLAKPPSMPSGWQPGDYHLTGGASGNQYPTRPGVSSVDISGGLSIWSSLGSGGGAVQQIDFTPLDGLHGPFIGEGMATNVNTVLQAVLPVNIQNLGAGTTTWVHFWVDDPYVNKFPGDWHVDSDASLASRVNNNVIAYSSPAFPGFAPPIPFPWARPPDPVTLAFSPQDGAMPKSRRMPSVGMLQNIRTGIVPDIANTNSPLAAQHGTPWRTLDFGTGQATDGGTRYPDWAMLDLFTVPASPQPVAAGGGSPPPWRDLTWGGSTAGRINPNGSVLVPWNLSRPAPLAAALQGMPWVDATGTTNTLAAGDASAVASGIANYVAAHGPFRTAGEVANVPEVAAYTQASGRNEIAAQLGGLLATRGNVFSVWVVGQSIQKIPSNRQYGQVEPGDVVTGESRVRYVVERYLDTGMDGVVGNSQSAGPDGLVGTWDDAAAAAFAGNAFRAAVPSRHPLQPTYKYRVLYAEPVSP